MSGNSLLLTAPLLQGFVNPWNRSTDPALEFPTPALRSILALPLDALVRESYAKRNEVTSDPIEDGEEVNAHVVRKPDTLTIEGVISDTPVSLIGIGAFSARPASGAIVKAAVQFLEAMVEARQPCDFIGTLYYKGYVFTDWNMITSARDGSSLKFMATLQRLKIVSSEVIPGANLSPAKNGGLKNAGKSSKGTVEPKPTTSSQDAYIETFRDPATGYILGG